MKELSIEQKAKRYDEAIKKAKEFKNNPFAGYDGTDLISSLFPELKESEDERIRKALIKAFEELLKQNNYDKDTNFKGVNSKEAIAWLEKQQKTQGKSALEAAKEEKVDNQNCVKPNDKIEPKFRFGDYIERKDGLGCHAKIIFVGGNVYGCEKIIHSEDESPFFEFMFKNQDEFQLSSNFKQKPVCNVEPKFKVSDIV